jgi:hypothetical protein
MDHCLQLCHPANTVVVAQIKQNQNSNFFEVTSKSIKIKALASFKLGSMTSVLQAVLGQKTRQV